LFVSLEDDLLVRHGCLGRLLASRHVASRDEGPIESEIVREEIARAQRIIEGQHWDMRRTQAKYAAIVEDQFAAVVAERRALLDGSSPVDVWREMPGPRTALVASAGEAAVDAAERRVRIGAIDARWRRHLAVCAELREGAHLARLGGREPLAVYTTAVLDEFAEFADAVDEAVGAALPSVGAEPGRALDVRKAVPPLPTTTWTYLVNDDPFRHTMGTVLTGAGGATIAIYAAALLGPLLVAWGVIERWCRPKTTRAGR
jgi:preprotein translocase subunit SecA